MTSSSASRRATGPFAPLAALRRGGLALAALALAVPGVLQLGASGSTARAVSVTERRAAGEAPMASGWSLSELRVDRGSGRPGGWVRVAVIPPAGRPVADVLFVHGHSDALDNHRDTFAAWTGAGMRVIAFDLPDHGGTQAGSLDTWDGDDLSRLLAEVERTTRQDRRRPLVLGGFSLGGELVVHTLVAPDLLAGLGRRPVAAVLLSPAVAVRSFSGGDGISRVRALVHPGGNGGPAPSPAIPLANPLFAAQLLVRGMWDRQQSFPGDVQVFVATGGPDQDSYVDVDAVRSWTATLTRSDRQVTTHTCNESRHAVDNEAWPLGELVRAASTDFLVEVLTGRPGSGRPDLPSGRCAISRPPSESTGSRQ